MRNISREDYHVGGEEYFSFEDKIKENIEGEIIEEYDNNQVNIID